MSTMSVTRVVTGYNPIVNGIGQASYLPYGPQFLPGSIHGFGQWSSVITASLQAGVALTTMLYQDKLRRDAETRAKHEAAREAENQRQIAALQAKAAADAAKAAQAQAAVTAGATGGALAVNAQGQLLPASGVAAMVPGGGNKTLILVGVIGVVAIGAIALMGRRR